MILVRRHLTLNLNQLITNLSLNDIKGENGTLIMFICNHCPYVKAITKEIVEDCTELQKLGINVVAICK